MKQRHLLHSLALLGCLLAFGCGLGRAQAPIAEGMDVYFGEAKLLTIDGPIDSYSVTPEKIVEVDKSDTSPNQLSLIGLASGSATLTVVSHGRTLLYNIGVSPPPQRLYINLNESKRLTFPNPIDDTSVSQDDIVHIVQPDTNNNVLLVEATTAGKTTLTVYCKGEIYRYFISTLENRGADVLEIENAFSAKGYRNLTITFDKDQAVIGGSVPTQEELDDAVRIVKQFTDFVQVKAELGQDNATSEYTEQEAVIINNIQRIANVPGLTVRVKFAMPSVVTTSTKTTEVGDYIEPATTTTPQGGTVRGSGFAPPTQAPQGPTNNGPTELKPLKNSTEVITRKEDTSVPEKIFLYGEMQNDLDEAKVIRVARTFCPFIVNFLTVKDPIQIRTQIRFMQLLDNKLRETGFTWTDGLGGSNGPTITLGFGSSALGVSSLLGGNPFASASGFTATANAAAVMHLYETLGVTKELRESDLFLTNGQPGWYSEGEVKTYVSGNTTVVGTATTNTSITTSSVFLGVNMDISPLNLVAAGSTEPQGQQVLGIQTSSTTGVSVTTPNENTADIVGKVGAIQGGNAPVVDSTVKYVDENGLIGMNVSTQLTVPGNFTSVDSGGTLITLPDLFVRTTRTRLNLRDGQTVSIAGLIDSQMVKNITAIPFLSSIPIFSNLFKGKDETSTEAEIIVLVTPHIVRMRDPDSARYPKPLYPEMQTMAREFGDVPIIKPVRYDAGGVDLRPEDTPKDMKNADIPSNSPPTPRTSGGMQSRQPAAYSSASAAAPAVDNAASSPDSSRQPSSAPLAPSSTLP